MFFLLSFLGVGLTGLEISYPTAYYNIYLAGRFMLVIAIVLGFMAIPAVILTVHSLEVAEACELIQEGS
jgi:hypothetical protein